MFEVNTFLEKKNLSNRDRYVLENQESSYIHLDDSRNIKEIIDHKKFTPEHIQMLITISYNNQSLLGFDIPSGLDLWNDFIHAIEVYIDEGEVETFYGIDPITIKIESLQLADNGFLRFSIFHEYNPDKIYVSSSLPEKEFLQSIVAGAKHFWNRMIEYRVFEKKEIRNTTPIDYPSRQLNKIQRIELKMIK